MVDQKGEIKIHTTTFNADSKPTFHEYVLNGLGDGTCGQTDGHFIHFLQSLADEPDNKN
jgi:hypothetical protein